jgi:hypothetical protein
VNDAENESPTSYDGPRQVHCPRRKLVASFNGVSGPGGTVIVRFPTPDGRLRGKWVLIGVPAPEVGHAPGSVVLAGRGITVWPHAVEFDQANGGQVVPVTNQIPTITKATPLPIPQDAGLGGYGREFVTMADAIDVEVVIPAQGGGVIGALYAQARYQPVSSTGFIPWKQWQEIRSLCEIEIVGGPVRT